jgi:hypothetical protein
MVLFDKLENSIATYHFIGGADIGPQQSSSNLSALPMIARPNLSENRLDFQ